MATTTGRGSSVKRTAVQAEVEAQVRAAAEAAQVARDQVEELARQGARQMLLAALEDEVNVYLAGAGPIRTSHGRRAGGGKRPPPTPAGRASAAIATGRRPGG